MEHRFTQEHIDRWRKEGFAIIPRFFKPDEIAPILDDFELLYQDRAPAKEDATERIVKEEHAIGSSDGVIKCIYCVSIVKMH